MITPPTLVLDQPFTKAIHVSITSGGAISIATCTLTGAGWKSTQIQKGDLTFSDTEIETGVADIAGERGRGLLQIEGEDWPDDWFGGSLQLIGKTPRNRPFVFGEIDFKIGTAGVYPAPSLIHTAKKITGMNSTLVTTEPYVPASVDRPKDRIIQTTVTSTRAPTVAFVLWLESNQTGYLKCKKLQGFTSPINLTL